MFSSVITIVRFGLYEILQIRFGDIFVCLLKNLRDLAILVGIGVVPASKVGHQQFSTQTYNKFSSYAADTTIE